MHWFRLSLIVFLIITLAWGISPAQPGQAQSPGFSLRFYGHGVNDIDRVKIRIDPQVPADVGTTDFTLEWWMKASPGDNTSQNVACGSNDGWITGNILFDRDIYYAGDYGDFGIALSGGRLAFGVNNGSTGTTLCGSANVTDGQWNHVAVTRNRLTGQLRLFVNGQLDAQASGPTGDMSYRNGRSGAPNDPFFVIGAEKHDAGSAYPSYRGWIDEVRLSTTLRYTINFVRPSMPFSADANTVALYHLDEGPAGACMGSILDVSGAVGGPSPGMCGYGGAAPAGPMYTIDTPFSAGSPTSTPTRTPTRTATRRRPIQRQRPLALPLRRRPIQRQRPLAPPLRRRPILRRRPLALPLRRSLETSGWPLMVSTIWPAPGRSLALARSPSKRGCGLRSITPMGWWWSAATMLLGGHWKLITDSYRFGWRPVKVGRSYGTARLCRPDSGRIWRPLMPTDQRVCL